MKNEINVPDQCIDCVRLAACYEADCMKTKPCAEKVAASDTYVCDACEIRY